MDSLRLLETTVRQVLTERADVLQHWRQQVPTLGNRVKSFENWLLVELVDRLCVAGANPIKTNGFLPDWRPSYWSEADRFLRVQKYLRSCRLKGPKIDVKSLNPDLSFVVGSRGVPMNVEIKTQMSPQEVLTDMGIVRCHNEFERRKGYRATFLWVLLEPEGDPFRRRFKRSTEKTILAAKARLGLTIVLQEPVGKYSGIAYSLLVP